MFCFFEDMTLRELSRQRKEEKVFWSEGLSSVKENLHKVIGNLSAKLWGT